MKKRNSKKHFFFFFIMLAMTTIRVFGQAQDEYCASLADFEGEVSIQKAGEEDWLPVEKGMPLEHQDRLKTGNDGYAEILYDDGSLVKMEENSEITLEEVSADFKSKKINSKISLWVGRLLLNIAKFTHSQSRFSVKTPTVVAGVRGTEFVVESLIVEQSDVGVIDGEVGVESLDEKGQSDESSRVVLKPGFQTSGFKFKKPVRPVPLKEQMLNHANRIVVLRKKAIEMRKNIPQIRENRKKTREIMIEKWKKYREQNPTRKRPKDSLRNPDPQRLPGGGDQPQNPQIKRLPKGNAQPQAPQIQRLPPKGPVQPQAPGPGIRKLPAPYIRKLPPPQSGGDSPIRNNQLAAPPAGSARTPPLGAKPPENGGGAPNPVFQQPSPGPGPTQPTPPQATPAPLLKRPLVSPVQK